MILFFWSYGLAMAGVDWLYRACIFDFAVCHGMLSTMLHGHAAIHARRQRCRDGGKACGM